MRREGIRVHRLTESDELRGELIIRVHTSNKFSMTDATSFALMERLHIRNVLTFDRDFQAYGKFVTL